MKTKPVIFEGMIEQFAPLAAKRRLDRETEIPTAHIEIEMNGTEAESNNDLKLGDGAWVQVWMFVSAAQIEEAQEPSDG